MKNFINEFNYQKFNKKSFFKFIKSFDDAEIVNKRRFKKTIRFVNIPCAFDIECSSFYDAAGNKTAIMYIWQLCINGICFYGRTYKEFWEMLECFRDAGYGAMKRFVFYVHNLSYEFNALHKYMLVGDYFAIDSRKPLYVSDIRGVEFRCSYRLSGYSLAYLGDRMLFKYPVKKSVGDLDYYLLRSPETKLSRKEMGYCINDVRVVTNYIQERLENGQTIANIEITKTGKVRNELYKACLRKGDRKHRKPFIQCMQECTIDSIETYREQKEATSGGFTHSNIINTGKVFRIQDGKGIVGYDISSDYPFFMATRKVPYGQPMKRDVITLREYKNIVNAGFHIIARFRFTDLNSTFIYDYYISQSKCYDYNEHDIRSSNGRVVRCFNHLSTTINEDDFAVIERTYEWSAIRITDVLIYDSNYLPKPFVETVLHFYEQKTTLKGVKGREPEYMNFKEMVNSIYGCMLTDMVRPVYTYQDGMYDVSMGDIWQQIDDYNKKKSRTSAYVWGGYITSGARRKLWEEAILPMAERYVYADTDSCYTIYDESVKAHFDAINEKVIQELEKVSKIRNIPLEKFMPKTIKGIEKPLGVWEADEMKDFKTLGAKRYITRDASGKYAITVAGLSKSAVGYIESEGGFDYFKNGMYIPPSDSGRITATYIDDLREGVMQDYKGAYYKYTIRCGVHFEPAEYNMSMHKLFIEYIKEMLLL